MRLTAKTRIKKRFLLCFIAIFKKIFKKYALKILEVCYTITNKEVFMFRYVKLQNYKSLIDLSVDLTSKKNVPQKFILIYGENGIGKSNFSSCFYTLGQTLSTKIVKESMQELLDAIKNNPNDQILQHISKQYFTDITTIIEQTKTIGSTDPMVLEFGFRLKGKNGVYRIELDDTKIISERLEYVLNKNVTEFFHITETQMVLNEKIFNNTTVGYNFEIKELLKQYWGKHSFLSILVGELEDKNRLYLKQRLASPLIVVTEFFNNLSINLKEGNHANKGKVGVSHEIFSELESGVLPLKQKDELRKAEEFLNVFFTSLYSDMKHLYYEQSNTKKNIKYKLYVKKQMNQQMVDVPFSLESTGTQNIFDMVPFLMNGVVGKVVVIDEIDAGIHDLLMSQIMENLCDSIGSGGQFIITTHNTMLLENDYIKKCAYIFHLDECGCKQITPLSAFEERFQQSHNMRKRYLQGLYGGVPIAMDIDFAELVDLFK